MTKGLLENVTRGLLSFVAYKKKKKEKKILTHISLDNGRGGEGRK